ncbi:IMP dehydrogenase [Halomonas sp. 18H]|uniref:IMP dehydrogenase n=1 Tax=Halomonas almeriensis TaxID=308163 RepID=UPI002230A810|nr:MULTISPECIES: IMP dehydrogenase [Halomonas]MCW4153745.1 IMP dehydrogenase [Halomonas sp. 18H]MDN3552100.1 IMP dehydrogenase [Halomonas almeriensis]
MLRMAQEALTFDDVLLLPGYSDVLPKDVSLRTRLTRNLFLNIPMASAAMDTVTEARLAIAMAQEGGIGIVHKSMTIAQQAAEVRKVKKHESVIVKDPVTVGPKAKLADLLSMAREYGFSGFPVVEGETLVGIVTERDMRFQPNHGDSVADIMTPREKLVTVPEGTSLEVIKSKMQEHRVEKMLAVNDAFHLRGLITFQDIEKARTFPHAAKDADGRLLVGAAVGTGPETADRIAALVEAGVDAVIVDTAHGHSKGVIDRVAWVKEHFPQIQVIGGNIATAEAARALAEAGADGVKVGIGPGSICTTRVVAGVGVPQITAVSNVAEALKSYDVPVIADGGIRYSGDLAKAVAAGASCVMAGGLLAGTEEAPGEVELYQGRTYKAYRGMGSMGAMSQTQGSSDRYFQDKSEGVEKLVPEGIEGRVPYKGLMGAIVHQMMGGLRASMGYTGCHSIDEMRTTPEFIKITGAGFNESHVHDVQITKEAPNYRAG